MQAGLVVVDAGAGFVAAWSAAADLGGFKVWPGCDGFEDAAFGPGVDAGLLWYLVYGHYRLLASRERG